MVPTEGSSGGSGSGSGSGGGGSLLKQTLMNVPECFLYKVPPMATAGGHRAEQWDLAHPIQTCGFQVERRDNDLYLLFTTDDHTKLFALAKLDEQDASNHHQKSLEQVKDSSRYFVTHIQNNDITTSGTKRALIGFGFRDRDVAIDLLGNLQQFQHSIQREFAAKNMKVTEIPKLGAGERMHIQFGNKDNNNNNINNNKKKSTRLVKDATPKSKSNGGGGGGNGGGGGGGHLLLKKPPKADDSSTDNVSTAPAAPLSTSSASTATATTTTIESVQLTMGDVRLTEDPNNIAANGADSDGGVAHNTKSAGQEQQPQEEEEEEEANIEDDDWGDFEQA